ncbi:Fic family protein [Neolewinella antarctica]|uniref:Fic family protein n=1 Tax=Neolewinella antarctica TaxID=442734 RepID=A0ABX0XDF9_9BACT|nr:Fic family protein [Neolewinella antarctica]NJC26792.1 Fic family protein [Neolewinella antarctica]
MSYKPPYQLSSRMIILVGEINQLIGQIQGYQLLTGDLKLRKENKIKTIISSLAIEGNTLSEEQVSDIIDGKPIMGHPREILEVKNALAVYDTIKSLNYKNEDHLLQSHKILMRGLLDSPGNYRQRGVAVYEGPKPIHIGPPHGIVPRLMGQLFEYITDYDEETIIKSCVFHYEFEFVHPFMDGNGRMGRLWQTVILMSKFPVLQFVPFETIIHQRQQGYYQALADSQSAVSSDPFIYFMLDALKTALVVEANRTNNVQDFESRLIAFREYFSGTAFSRKDYQIYHKSVSSPTASRDLLRGVELGVLTKKGKQRNTLYEFKFVS